MRHPCTMIACVPQLRVHKQVCTAAMAILTSAAQGTGCDAMLWQGRHDFTVVHGYTAINCSMHAVARTFVLQYSEVLPPRPWKGVAQPLGVRPCWPGAKSVGAHRPRGSGSLPDLATPLPWSPGSALQPTARITACASWTVCLLWCLALLCCVLFTCRWGCRPPGASSSHAPGRPCLALSHGANRQAEGVFIGTCLKGLSVSDPMIHAWSPL